MIGFASRARELIASLGCEPVKQQQPLKPKVPPKPKHITKPKDGERDLIL